jgi:hypothetical protein
MSLERFESHLHDPFPAFRCYACTDTTEQLPFTASVRNRIDHPASTIAVATLKVFLGDSAPAMQGFYRIHDGIVLYCDPRSDAAGMEFFPTAQWQSKTEDMRQTLPAIGIRSGPSVEWLYRGIAFAEIPHSANYFVLETSGESKGRIFYANHDEFNPAPFAEAFDKLLQMILADPAGFPYRCGCYTRYADGVTDTQWIAKEYLSGRES